MTTQHTPGPLHLGRAAGERAIYGPKGEWVATLPNMLTDDETLANAKLFIAAPDLLAALVELEAATSAMDTCHGTSDFIPGAKLRRFEAAKASARSAIAKATTP